MGKVADELRVRSRRDDAVIVGSEIRAALSDEGRSAFEAGWTMYADSGLTDRMPDEMEIAYQHYIKRPNENYGGIRVQVNWTFDPPTEYGWYWCRIRCNDVWLDPMIADLRRKHRHTSTALRKCGRANNRMWWPERIIDPNEDKQ